MRRNNLKKRIMAFLGAVLMMGTVWLQSVPAYADNKSKEDAAAKTEAQQKINSIQAQIDNKKKELEDANKVLKDAKKNTSDTKNQLNALNNRNAILQEEINLLDDQITTTEEAIAQSELDEEAQTELFHQQVRMEEEAGDISYWSVLFRATGIGDLLARVDFVNEIMDYNNSVIEKLRDLRAQLQDQKVQLNDQMEEKDAAQEVLAGQVKETEALYKEYKKTQEAAQAEYDMIAKNLKQLDTLMTEAKDNLARLGITEYAATSGGYAWPMTSVRGVTSHFGGRKSPGGIGSTNHKGTDFAAPMYTKIYAAKAGTVTRAANKYDGYGVCIIIYHGTGNYTLYGHLSSCAVKEGDTVSQGQLIGYSGNTGNSTGPHLHFGIQENNTWVDPLNYLSGWYWCGG